MFRPFSRTVVFKKAFLLALFTLEILWSFQGKGLFGQNELESAIQQKEDIAYAKALDSFRKLRQTPAYQEFDFALQLENEMLEIFLTLAEFDSAQFHLNYPKNWEARKVEDATEALCNRYHLRAQFFLLKKEYKKGQLYLEEVDSIFQLYKPEQIAKIRLRKVRLDIATGKFGSAGERLKELELGLETYHPLLKADFHFEKGFYHQLYKRFDISVKELGKALDLYGENLSPLHPKIGLTHTFLSYTYRGKYELKKSLQSIRAALKIQEQVLGFKHPHLATTYYYYATSLNMIGDYPSSAKYNTEAIRVYKQAMGDAGNSLGNYYASLGYAKRGMNQMEEAEDAYRRALDYYLAPPVFRQIDMPYYNYSITLLKNKKFAQALDYLNKAFEVRKERHGENSPLLLNIYEEYGAAYMGSDKWKEARRYYEKCLEIEEVNPQKLETRIAAYKNSIGEIERILEHPRTALTYQEEALAHLGYDMSAESMDELDIIGTGRPDLVSDIFLEIAQLLRELAEKDKEEGLKEQALQIYKQCDYFIDQRRLSFFSEEAKLSLAGKAREIFEKGISLAYELYEETGEKEYLETALYFSGKSKSLLLLLGLKESFALQSSGIPEHLTQREWELELELANLKTERYELNQSRDENREKLEEIEQKLFQAERARDSLINTLEKNFPDYHALKYELALPSVAEIQTRIPANMKVLDYFWGEGGMYIFSLDQKELNGYKLEVKDSSLLDKINEFRMRVFNPFMGEHDADFIRERNEFAALSYGLRRELLPEELINELAGFNRLKVIPDGALGYLNYGLLLKEDTRKGTSYRDMPYLFNDQGLSYAFSIGQWWHLLLKGPIKLKGKDDLLAFRPSYPETGETFELELAMRKGFGPLYYSKQEIEQISQYFDTQIFEEEEATEKSFYQWAAEFPLIQISGHAMIPDSAPSAAFIAFTDVNSSQYDDSLMLEELYAQRLHAEMVVLSACETGIGELYRGEGIMSLGRGFTYAGARSLVSSLWEVNDRSTAMIMKSFYQYLSEGMEKDLALRQAKKDYLSKSDQFQSHPYFWAAFVANGDMKALEMEEKTYAWVWALGFIIVALLGLAVFKFKREPV